MSKTIDFPDLDAAIDAEAVALEVKRGHTPGDIRQRFMRLTQRQPLALRLEQAARHLQRGTAQ